MWVDVSGSTAAPSSPASPEEEESAPPTQPDEAEPTTTPQESDRFTSGLSDEERHERRALSFVQASAPASQASPSGPESAAPAPISPPGDTLASGSGLDALRGRLAAGRQALAETPLRYDERYWLQSLPALVDHARDLHTLQTSGQATSEERAHHDRAMPGLDELITSGFQSFDQTESYRAYLRDSSPDARARLENARSTWNTLSAQIRPAQSSQATPPTFFGPTTSELRTGLADQIYAHHAALPDHPERVLDYIDDWQRYERMQGDALSSTSLRNHREYVQDAIAAGQFAPEQRLQLNQELARAQVGYHQARVRELTAEDPPDIHDNRPNARALMLAQHQDSVRVARGEAPTSEHAFWNRYEEARRAQLDAQEQALREEVARRTAAPSGLGGGPGLGGSTSVSGTPAASPTTTSPTTTSPTTTSPTTTSPTTTSPTTTSPTTTSPTTTSPTTTSPTTTSPTTTSPTTTSPPAGSAPAVNAPAGNATGAGGASGVSDLQLQLQQIQAQRTALANELDRARSNLRGQLLALQQPPSTNPATGSPDNQIQGTGQPNAPQLTDAAREEARQIVTSGLQAERERQAEILRSRLFSPELTQLRERLELRRDTQSGAQSRLDDAQRMRTRFLDDPSYSVTAPVSEIRDGRPVDVVRRWERMDFDHQVQGAELDVAESRARALEVDREVARHDSGIAEARATMWRSELALTLAGRRMEVPPPVGPLGFPPDLEARLLASPNPPGPTTPALRDFLLGVPNAPLTGAWLEARTWLQNNPYAPISTAERQEMRAWSQQFGFTPINERGIYNVARAANRFRTEEEEAFAHRTEIDQQHRDAVIALNQAEMTDASRTGRRARPFDIPPAVAQQSAPPVPRIETTFQGSYPPAPVVPVGRTDGIPVSGSGVAPTVRQVLVDGTDEADPIAPAGRPIQPQAGSAELPLITPQDWQQFQRIINAWGDLMPGDLASPVDPIHARLGSPPPVSTEEHATEPLPPLANLAGEALMQLGRNTVLPMLEHPLLTGGILLAAPAVMALPVVGPIAAVGTLGFGAVHGSILLGRALHDGFNAEDERGVGRAIGDALTGGVELFASARSLPGALRGAWAETQRIGGWLGLGGGALRPVPVPALPQSRRAPLEEVPLADLELGEAIGAGGAPNVHALGEREVAVMLGQNERGAGSAQALRRQLDHMQGLANVEFEGQSVAPQVRRVITDGQGNPIGYVAERVPGEQLGVLAQRGALNEAQLGEVGRQLRGQMRALHRAGAIQGDANPNNIHVEISPDGNVRARFIGFDRPSARFGQEDDAALLEQTLASASANASNPQIRNPIRDRAGAQARARELGNAPDQTQGELGYTEVEPNPDGSYDIIARDNSEGRRVRQGTRFTPNGDGTYRIERETESVDQVTGELDISSAPTSSAAGPPVSRNAIIQRNQRRMRERAGDVEGLAPRVDAAPSSGGATPAPESAATELDAARARAIESHDAATQAYRELEGATTPDARATAQTAFDRARARANAMGTDAISRLQDRLGELMREGRDEEAAALARDFALGRAVGFPVHGRLISVNRDLSSMTPEQWNSFARLLAGASNSNSVVQLPDPVRFLPGVDLPEVASHPRISQEIARLGLEEWTHVLQSRVNGPTSGLTQQWLREAGPTAGWAEADILATMIEQRVPITQEWLGRYPVRSSFLGWYSRAYPSGFNPLAQPR